MFCGNCDCSSISTVNPFCQFSPAGQQCRATGTGSVYINTVVFVAVLVPLRGAAAANTGSNCHWHWHWLAFFQAQIPSACHQWQFNLTKLSGHGPPRRAWRRGATAASNCMPVHPGRLTATALVAVRLNRAFPVGPHSGLALNLITHVIPLYHCESQLRYSSTAVLITDTLLDHA